MLKMDLPNWIPPEPYEPPGTYLTAKAEKIPSGGIQPNLVSLLDHFFHMQ